MKLIFLYNWCVPYESSGTNTIPFEYSSLEEFQFMILEKIQEHKQKGLTHMLLFGYTMDIDEASLESIESITFTLDDWFEKNKEIKIMQIYLTLWGYKNTGHNGELNEIPKVHTNHFQ